MKLHAINDFWMKFEDLHQELYRFGDLDPMVYDDLLEALHRVNRGLYIELCGVSTPKEFIVNADGKAHLFDLVQQVVDQAPPIEGWAFFALKPRLGLPVKVGWNDIVLSTKKIKFVPRTHAETDDLGIDLLVSGIPEDRKDDAHNALLRGLDAALGERLFAESIKAVWVKIVSKEEQASRGYPLSDLYDYVVARIENKMSD